MIEGQTTVDRCEFCHEPAVEEVQLTPAEYESREGVPHLVKHAVNVHACALHRDRIRGGVRLAGTDEGHKPTSHAAGQGTAQARPAEADLTVAA